ELALPVETAAFVLLSGAAGAGSVARNEADAGEPRSSSGRPVRSAPGAGADARTEERGAEMEAPPRRIGRNAGHRRRSPFGSVPVPVGATYTSDVRRAREQASALRRPL